MFINVCYLVFQGLIRSEKSGNVKLMDFFNDWVLNKLYEKFILNYYKREHKKISTSSPQIQWQLELGYDSMLPKMKTDVTLEYENKILIIDAKFYKHNTAQNFGKDIHHTSNLYQIFTYVKNKQVEVKEKDVEVSGMLLYAKTNEGIQSDSDYVMSGNKISVKTLDLNQEFHVIKSQLDEIVKEYLTIN